jgi:hypothetical protein
LLPILWQNGNGLQVQAMIEYSDSELVNVPAGTCFVWDVESYPNFWCVCFRDINTKKHVIFEHSPDKALDLDKLRWFVWRFCLVGFNTNNYDLLMLTLALWGKSPEELKQASDDIIFPQHGSDKGLRPWKFCKKYGIEIPQLNSVDLMEVAPLDASLKLYGGRMHCRTLRELPYRHDTVLTREEAANVVEYCCNDLDITELLLIELAPHIELRQDLGKEYGRDLRSLSDAQVAEAIICIELHKKLGYYPKTPPAIVKEAHPEVYENCTYKVPTQMQFQTPLLRDALKVVAGSTFIVNGDKILMPEALKKLSLRIGNSTYKLGMGGLHSQEKSAAYVATSKTLLIDRDVASYYPAIVLNQGLFPAHLGEEFLSRYRNIVERRLAAKKGGFKKISEGLKIAINGIFGKLGNMYSAVYSPDLMLQVTISGQLYLLMLIEAIELAGIPVVSGNTDGVVINCPTDRYDDLLNIVQQWEKITGFVTEETRYKALYSRDVNNYIAIKEKGDEKAKLFSDRIGCKVKGTYSEVGSAQNSVLSKNPESLICNDAVLAFLVNGTPLRETVESCTDPRRFCTVRTVKGGAQKNGQFLGKVVRWYYKKKETGAIHYCLSGNQVANSEGAWPLMVLPDKVPSDIDFNYYVNRCEEMLYDIGKKQRPKSLSFF